jgi:hypothetical protein
METPNANWNAREATSTGKLIKSSGEHMHSTDLKWRTL